MIKIRYRPSSFARPLQPQPSYYEKTLVHIFNVSRYVDTNETLPNFGSNVK